MSEIKVKLPGRDVGMCDRAAYVKAKTKQMREFGYPDLTEAHVDEQITALLAGKKFGDGLTVIGMFMDKEVLP